jgi:hypothetical protein
MSKKMPEFNFIQFSDYLPRRSGLYLIFSERSCRVWPELIPLETVTDIINTNDNTFSHWCFVQNEE